MVSEVFYRLLQKRQLPLQDPDIMKIINDEELQQELEAMAEAFECRIGYYGDSVYLIPDGSNHFLGYSKSELKKRLLKSNQPVSYYYLYMFIVLTLMQEFYGTSYGGGKSRSYIKMDSLATKVRENLAYGADNSKAPAQVPYSRMLLVYDSLKPEFGKNEKNSIRQLFETILSFLEEQNLIVRVDEDESIRTTPRLDDLADNILRGSEGKRLMEQILGGEEDA